MHQCHFHLGCFLSVRLPLVTLLTSLQSGNFAIFKNTRVFFSLLFFIICVFTQMMHLFHVRFCQTANFDSKRREHVSYCASSLLQAIREQV